MLAEFTESADTVVHAYSGGQLASLIKKVAVTSSQIGSKSMTLTDSNGELSDEDVANRKQQELGKQIWTQLSVMNSLTQAGKNIAERSMLLYSI